MSASSESSCTRILPSISTAVSIPQSKLQLCLAYVPRRTSKTSSYICVYILVCFLSDRRKAQFKLGWRESTLYPDWRKEEFQTVNVTLDEATAHPRLLLTEDGRGVTLQEIQQDLPSSTQRFVSIPCVLGQPQICSGRSYWEVEVGDLHSWDLGVCRDNVSRKETFQMSPQNGFWAIRLYQEDYWALTISETLLTLREKPLSVGIFLDYEAGDVSFYNMTDESHIFTFSKQTFYGVLRPLFRLWSPDSRPLTIVQVE
ncbi:butyrophilin subfamily 1 member A1-like [Oryx dammah]|uniref:butyrophilin subfamily 1 member A1-like n=1 Tax=Oryx dammah TaxID=59534 RepID=UPI001A9BC034|nr:butyrophilin subfamily 1 member A1-like [Oryx dammah]